MRMKKFNKMIDNPDQNGFTTVRPIVLMTLAIKPGSNTQIGSVNHTWIGKIILKVGDENVKKILQMIYIGGIQMLQNMKVTLLHHIKHPLPSNVYIKISLYYLSHFSITCIICMC